MKINANKEWIDTQFEYLNLGDKRLNNRARLIASNMVEKPSASIPEQNNGWCEVKGAYRFFDSEKINFSDIVGPHINLTKKKVAKKDVILAIQDTCYISYSHHGSISGLSDIGGEKRNTKGIILHNTLAVDPTKPYPEVIGVIDQHIHDRNKNGDKDEGWKETNLWSEASQRIHLKNSNCQIIEVMDREGDVFDIMQNCLSLGHDYVIRAAYNRRVNDVEEIKLFDFVKKIKPKGTVELDIRKKQGQIPRKAKLEIAFSKATICGPKNRKNEIIECNIVRVFEKKPPKDQEPLEWVLFTSIDVNSFDDACQIIEWYRYRWLIEEYHKCIKSGCKVEEKQFKEGFRIENYLGIANVVAIRLLQLRSFARNSPEISAKKIIEPLKVDLLLKHNNLRERDISIYRYYRLVAKLGGFIGRKSDGEPGWQTLWKGEMKLALLLKGAKLALGSVNYG